MSWDEEKALDELAVARFGKREYERFERDTPRSRTMRENVSWALEVVRAYAEAAYSEGQYAGFEDCLADAEDKSVNPYKVT